jgi:diguanylate cyclase (GGDEF)-like protein
VRRAAHRLSPWSLRKVLILPVALLVVAVASTIGALSYVAGRDAVDEVAHRLLLETRSRIGQAVERHVVGSRAVLEAALPEGMTMPETIEGELPALRRRFWIATSLHTNPNDYVYYGSQSGQFFGLKRLSPGEAELRLKLDPQQRRRFMRVAGIDGAERLSDEEVRPYEPRDRPWYVAGQSATAHTWTAVYIDFRTQELVATRARKVLSAGGHIQGVVATDVSLRALNDFVASLRISEHGFAFIVEPDGNLIAASVGGNIVSDGNGRMGRLHAAASGQPMIQAAYVQMQAALAATASPALPQTRQIAGAHGEPVTIAFDRLRDEAGLDWWVVVGMPDMDFTAGIADNLWRTVWLGAGALVLAVLGGAAFYAWIARDLRRLTATALRISQGDLESPVDVVRNDEIGELARGLDSIQQRLRTDALTGLANRHALQRRLEILLHRHRMRAGRDTVGVLFVDLDNFKQVNDRLGHEAGDQALRDVATCLRASVREGDLVARYAGDEFVVVLSDLPDRTSAETVRAKVESALSDFGADGNVQVSRVGFTGSVGLAVYPEDADTADELVRRADEDMYRRKQGGRSVVDHDPT